MSAPSLSPNRRNSLPFSTAGAAGVLPSNLQALTRGGAVRPFRIDIPVSAILRQHASRLPTATRILARARPPRGFSADLSNMTDHE
jgi:hypothetical protein